jgi:hypothetical protein
MNPYLPELDRARRDPAFRQKLLQQRLETLLGSLHRQRLASSSDAASDEQMREGVTLAVRLAELIQTPAGPPSKA